MKQAKGTATKKAKCPVCGGRVTSFNIVNDGSLVSFFGQVMVQPARRTWLTTECANGCECMMAGKPESVRVAFGCIAPPA